MDRGKENIVTFPNGEKIGRGEFDRRIVKAKERKTDQFVAIHGYPFCERCTRNDCIRIARSHIVSVSECLRSGNPALAYDEENLELLGKRCHDNIESWTERKRFMWFKMRLEGKSFMNFLEKWAEENGTS